jgi:hypothetical protein
MYIADDEESEDPTRKLTSPFENRTRRVEFTHEYSSFSGGSGGGTQQFYNLVETKESRGHPYGLLGHTTGNIGGKFAHTKLHVDKFGDNLAPYVDGTTWRRASGTWSASAGFLSDLTPNASSETYNGAAAIVTTNAPMVPSTQMDAYGTTAIARVSPTNPLVDLSSSVAELYREGLPTLPGSQGNPGSEYLNIQFGYLPLINDAKQLAAVARQHDALLRQYERDSGRWIRRQYQFPPQTTTTSLQSSTAPAPLGGSVSGLAQVGTLTRTTTTETKIWFSGAFTYYLPRSGWRRTVAELDHLYGIRPGIDTVWELTGYSWLADYFVNIGDVAKNITAFKQDGLVMPYGFVMAKTTTEREETWTGPMRFGEWKSTTITSKKTYTTHQRRLANPFGFGKKFGDLSGRQLSILAALGISRM